MIAKLSLLLVCAAIASGNPAVGKPWHWKSLKPLVDQRGHAPGSSRIVSGTEAEPHSWPHQVALFINGLYLCGGSLISNEWILTAAYCLDGAGSVDVVMGAHNIQQYEDTQVTMTSTDFLIHEDWDPQLFKNDISLIRLPQAVSFDSNIQAVKLPSDDVSVGNVATLTGWGLLSDSDGTITDVLRQVDVPVISNDDCNAVYGTISDSQLCIDSEGGKGFCNGDSGGPLNLNGFTYGIASFIYSDSCEDEYPDGFTRVHYYLDWIEKKTGITP